MDPLKQILDELVHAGALEVEHDNQDPDRAARYRVSDDALPELTEGAA